MNNGTDFGTLALLKYLNVTCEDVSGNLFDYFYIVWKNLVSII